MIVLIIPMIVRYITNRVFKFEINYAIKVIIVLSIVVFILSAINYACNRYTNYYGRNMGSEIEKDMCNELLDHYQKQSFSFFDENKTGKLTAIMTVDIRNISFFLHFAPETILDFSIRTIGALIVFFTINAWFGSISALILGLVLLYTSYFIPKIQNATKTSHEEVSDLNAEIEETLSGIRIVQSFVNEKLKSKKFYELNKQHLNNQKKIHKIDSILNSGLNSFIIGLIPIITIISTFFVINGNLSMNDLITYVLYIDILISPIFTITALIQNYQESIVGYKKFFNVLKIKSKITNFPDALVLKNIKGSIEFTNVFFKYEKSSKNVFQNFNLKINSGECVALVGSSGAGKTTLCDLIPRFYDVSSGEILIDGINIKKIKLSNLRRNIGFVHQDAFLFSGTIMENISYGKPSATDEKIITAAKNAYAHDFIMSFPKGYATIVGQRGAKLSGGQKQRISIARVFLKNPPILIFDEATSSLDNESEKYIQKSMEKLSENRTTIVIAHRLSTIKNIKRILVLANGRIMEEGSHEELLVKNNIYTEFYNLF